MNDQLYTLYANLRERGLGEAVNYAVFRSLFGVHGRKVSWLLNRFHPYPPFIEVEITTACDLRCVMCEHTHWAEPQVMMPYTKFIHILDEFPKLRWIDITGIGEGILHKRFVDMVTEIKKRGIYLELYDAFHRWDKEMSQFMVGVGLNRIQPSIDGASKEVYERIRVMANFEEVYENLDHLHREKELTGRLLPEVSYHFIVQKRNQHEMGEYIRMVRFLAGHQRVTVQFTELLYEYPEIRGQKHTVTEDQRDYVEEEARCHDVRVRWNRHMGTQLTPAPQCTLWGMPFIFVDGSVIRCCTSNEHNARDRQRENAMGNIFETPMREIWEGDRFRALRRQLDEGYLGAGCKDCPTFCGREGVGVL